MEQTETGAIDWSGRVITAAGAPASPSDDGAAARQAAFDLAAKNLFETILSLRIREKTLVRHALEKKPDLREQLMKMAAAAYPVSIRLLEENRVEAVLSLSMKGPFSELILPDDIHRLGSVQQVEVQKPHGDDSEKSEDAPEKEKSAPPPLTGLLVDARGLEARPALVMRVLDEEGEPVYGTAFVSREFVVEHGMAAYVTDMESALAHERVAKRPLVVKGIKTWGVGRSDIVISNLDAAKLKSASEHLAFLRKCRVIIVLN